MNNMNNKENNLILKHPVEKPHTISSFVQFLPETCYMLAHVQMLRYLFIYLLENNYWQSIARYKRFSPDTNYST